MNIEKWYFEFEKFLLSLFVNIDKLFNRIFKMHLIKTKTINIK